MSRTTLTLHKAQRRIVIDLGDDAERLALKRLIDGAIDVLEGKRRSVCEPERFCILAEEKIFGYVRLKEAR